MPNVNLHLLIPSDVKDRLDAEAKREGLKPGQLARRILIYWANAFHFSEDTRGKRADKQRV